MLINLEERSDNSVNNVDAEIFNIDGDDDSYWRDNQCLTLEQGAGVVFSIFLLVGSGFVIYKLFSELD